ncbi:uncharacterized protein Dwil_GK27751 [Drosophila willistoni]|uniref:C-type lectin 37Db n=1 Tax=Drosophila willistoni TaxID=7260 RepID=UPI000732A026|nr:C-type lectin 37Db [Drosophila willistoni]KRF97965.1 uncharacterized protein Dwil_GK27751 [Drosophila willistoni]
MPTYLNFLGLILMVSQFYWGALGHKMSSCDGHCFAMIRPTLTHIKNNQQRWKDCFSAHQDIQNRSENLARYLVENDETNPRLEAMKLNRRCGVHTERQKDEIREKFIQLGSKYYFVERNHRANWFGALQFCRQMGAHLASPQNLKELVAIRKLLEKYRDHWLDINDLAQTDQYVSDTTGKRATFLLWSPNEPNKRHKDELCVSLRMKEYDQNMEVSNCNRRYQHFICETQLN